MQEARMQHRVLQGLQILCLTHYTFLKFNFAGYLQRNQKLYNGGGGGGGWGGVGGVVCEDHSCKTLFHACGIL